MPKTLTRQALYDLVWSRPRTALAKELGVSDVAIGKHCVRARVPAPQAGYWARINAGGKAPRPQLPLRLPGQANLVVIGLQPPWLGTYRESFGELSEPPTFEEEIEAQVADALKRVGKVGATRDLGMHDAGLARVVGAEAKRREKYAKSGWSMDQPYFDEPLYQRQLRIFNSLSRAMSAVCEKREVRGQAEWVQGFGHLQHLSLHLDFGPVSMNLELFEPVLERRNRDRRKVSSTTLSVGSERALAGLQEWSDQPGRKLESQLPDIVAQLLRRAEVTLRATAQWQYEYALKQREEERAAHDARERAAEAKRQAALEAERAKVRDEVVEIARRRRVAEDIRSTVLALQGHPEALGEAGARLKAWSERALKIADHLDPMCASLESILGSFDLK